MFKKLGKKTKALGVVAATTILTTASQAAPNNVSFNNSTGAFEGAIDLTAYYSGVEIAVAVVGVTLGIALFFNMLKKARG